MIRTSVIIPTRDAAGPLRRCLAALLGSFPADAETIVVLDGGDVNAEPLLHPFAEPLRLRWLRAQGRGPAHARNRGLAEARGEIAVFTDDDCRPRPGWVDALTAAASASPSRAVGGLTVNGLDSNPYADAAQVVLDMVARHDRASPGGERFHPCNNCAFPISALRQLGGFDESYRTAEDRELCRRWSNAGFSLGLAPDAIVDHDADTDFTGYWRKFFGYGRGAARFHAGGNGATWRHTARFHFRLPALMAPAVWQRGPRRGARLAALLALWEVANLAGFVAERTGLLIREPAEASRVAPRMPA